ncbi:hypothetical protein NUU61_001682 [Penicillium alfredii]|uniref:Uncharacterized protein n=1 Tax=Penicillium alfredii TaxID=1506179 RepID=A0A9W9FQ67_9EURO|nr:uncharacterized protein NUU61_001682 [Penicillium alfredii]KAJ5104335.1 hypothetical protein NUU61_001682 [Penicillium alfredii]
MQRAAASAAAKEPEAPASDDNPPTPKRPRLSTEPGSPGTPRSDLDAISAALAAEEEKRREAVARQAAEAGETEWVLDVPPATNQYAPQPLVVAADSLDADEDACYGGRRSYGNFKRKKSSTPQQSQQSADKKKESDDEDMNMMNPSDPAQVEAMINKAKEKAAKKEKERNRPEKVRLSELTSISGSRQGGTGAPSQKKKKRKSR